MTGPGLARAAGDGTRSRHRRTSGSGGAIEAEKSTRVDGPMAHSPDAGSLISAEKTCRMLATLLAAATGERHVLVAICHSAR